MTNEAPPAPRRPRPRRWVTITSKEQINPHLVLIRLQGESLADFAVQGPGAHVKLMLPPPGEMRPTEPQVGEDGRFFFPEGTVRPFTRTYTPLRYNPETLELDIELLVHGEGAASTWVQSAEVGHEIIVLGPGGGWQVPDDGDWYIVAADDTAIPAVSELLPVLPRAAKVAFLEVSGPDDVRLVRGSDGSNLEWLFRGDDPEKAGELLEERLHGIDLPEGKGYVWVACEANAMRRIRKHLIEERGLPAEQMVTRGYWRRGFSDHPDGDYGQRELS